MPLCGTLLRVAEAGFYQPFFSQEILDGATRNLVLKTRMSQSGAHRFQSHVIAAFPEALKTVPEGLSDRMTNHPGDRHVVAAAVAPPSCELIVTYNLKHFKPVNLQQWNVVAVHPDSFLCELCDEFGDNELFPVICQQSADLTNPPIPVPELLEKLAQGSCSNFAERMLVYLRVVSASL